MSDVKRSVGLLQHWSVVWQEVHVGCQVVCRAVTALVCCVAGGSCRMSSGL